jgi:hypothetical protein
VVRVLGLLGLLVGLLGGWFFSHGGTAFYKINVVVFGL